MSERTFNLWRGNLIANHYTLTEKEILDKFVASPVYDNDSIFSWSMRFRTFVMRDLSSVMDDSDYAYIDNELSAEFMRKRGYRLPTFYNSA